MGTGCAWRARPPQAHRPELWQHGGAAGLLQHGPALPRCPVLPFIFPPCRSGLHSSSLPLCRRCKQFGEHQVGAHDPICCVLTSESAWCPGLGRWCHCQQGLAAGLVSVGHSWRSGGTAGAPRDTAGTLWGTAGAPWGSLGGLEPSPRAGLGSTGLCTGAFCPGGCTVSPLLFAAF